MMHLYKVPDLIDGRPICREYTSRLARVYPMDYTAPFRHGGQRPITLQVTFSKVLSSAV